MNNRKFHAKSWKITRVDCSPRKIGPEVTVAAAMLLFVSRDTQIFFSENRELRVFTFSDVPRKCKKRTQTVDREGQAKCFLMVIYTRSP